MVDADGTRVESVHLYLPLLTAHSQMYVLVLRVFPPVKRTTWQTAVPFVLLPEGNVMRSANDLARYHGVESGLVGLGNPLLDPMTIHKPIRAS